MKELKKIRYWIFDLDNTLYSATTNVFGKIDKKMCEFIMENLNVSKEEALKIKNDYFHSHGTTLNGLMKKQIVFMRLEKMKKIIICIYFLALSF